jgi:hypothetical protein
MTVSVKKPAVKKVAAKKPVAKAPAKLVFEADVHKETPGAFQFREDAESREVEVSGGIYVRKNALGEGVAPERIRVTVEVIR